MSIYPGWNCMVRIWNCMAIAMADRTGLWRINAIIWSRQADRLNKLANVVDPLAPQSAALLHVKATELRTAARDANPKARRATR